VGAAVTMIELIVQSSARYQMVATLHQQAIEEDFRQLTAKHQALLKSEARYKTLADDLERRVSEQVKTIETAHRQLYQAEKLASVGQLAAGLAHEINNPIGFMMSNLKTSQGYLERLSLVAEGLHRDGQHALWKARWAAEDLDFVIADFRDLLLESLSGAERVAKIVADLQGFSRVDAPSAEIADLNDLIRRVCNVSEGNLRGKATLKLELSTLPSLRCHAGQLGQVLLNMLLNAVQSLEKPGEIQFASMAYADTILIKIRDTGPGIPPEILLRIFDPFFTTKQVGQGTGLGLTVCNDIVKSHGGRIDVDTTLGQGTTFTIVLPRGGNMGI
jgi:signal transduction histidine kinase